jgi:hypothetical protein
MSLLHEELLHAEVDDRLARAKAARFKHSFDTLRRWVRRAERAQIGLARALAVEPEQPTIVVTTRGSVTPALMRSGDSVAGWT